MIRKLLVPCLVVGFFTLLSVSSAAELTLPHWLAAKETTSAPWRLTKSVTLDEQVSNAKLKIAADFAHAAVSINDFPALAVEAHCQLQTVDITHSFQVGLNKFQVDVASCAGPSAVALQIEIQLQSGRTILLSSDETWVATAGGKAIAFSTLEAVRSEMWGSGCRDISLSPVENYEQWRQALSSGGQEQPKFWTAEGFEISLVRTALADEGSWISLVFDPQGRAIVSREDQGLLRLTLNNSHTAVESVEPLEVDLKECRGLAFYNGELFANANNSKGLHRLKFTADGRVAELSLVRAFAGSVGHGRNDITIIDDWLYTIHGDSVDLPDTQIVDLTSPVRHPKSEESRCEGHLLRMHIPTGKWEIVCAGLRNPYGIASHPSGEFFTFDADNEFDMGTPWYRPTRVVALVTGGDLGYRTASNKLPPRFHDQPENLPPVLTIGRSSPTAVYHDPSLDFPQPYRDALYLLDWTYGRVIAVHMTPHGAGWRAQPELFVQGRPLNVTDVARGPDGAMYLMTGGRKTQSSLYRISCKSAETASASQLKNALTSVTSHEAAVAQFSESQRIVRSRLEEASRAKDARALDLIFESLESADPILRSVAQTALERLPLEAWRIRAFAAKLETSMQGHLVLARVMEPSDVSPLLDKWLRCDPNSLDLSHAFVWLRLCELMSSSNREAVQLRSEEVNRQLLRAWPKVNSHQVSPYGTVAELRQRLAIQLGAIESESSISLIARDLFTSTVQEDQLAGLLALRHQKSGWSMDQRRQQFELMRDPVTMIGGQGLPAFLAGIKADSFVTLSSDEKVAVREQLEPRRTEEPAALIATRPLVRKWKVEELVGATEANNLANAQEGQSVFREAQCARCHRFGSMGNAVGPDLTFVGRRFSSQDLLGSIVTPSLSVAENYRLDAIVTSDGKLITGTILVEGDYRSEKLRIQTDPLRTNSVIEIEKRDIEEHRQLDRSPMPDGLLDSFTREEIANLLAYLRSS